MDNIERIMAQMERAENTYWNRQIFRSDDDASRRQAMGWGIEAHCRLDAQWIIDQNLRPPLKFDEKGVLCASEWRKVPSEEWIDEWCASKFSHNSAVDAALKRLAIWEFREWLMGKQDG